MNAIIRDRIAACKRRLEERLDKNNFPDDLTPSRFQYQAL